MTFAADDHRHQDFEVQWWGDCTTGIFSEINKQLVYAHLMGLVQVSLGEKWPVYDLGRRSVLDVGGGPCSILLNCLNAGDCLVIDPGDYPAWTRARYEHCRIGVIQERAEDALDTIPPGAFDEAWIYNVLQHTVDPEKIIAGMRTAARTIRVFEWIEHSATLGHPHTLHAAELDEWLGGEGHVEQLNRNGCVGLSYSGIFRK